jgi:hypothetical protein
MSRVPGHEWVSNRTVVATLPTEAVHDLGEQWQVIVDGGRRAFNMNNNMNKSEGPGLDVSVLAIAIGALFVRSPPGTDRNGPTARDRSQGTDRKGPIARDRSQGSVGALLHYRTCTAGWYGFDHTSHVHRPAQEGQHAEEPHAMVGVHADLG